MNFKIKIKRSTKYKIKKIFAYGSAVADVIFMIKSLRNKPSVPDYVAAGLKVLHMSTDFIEYENDEPMIADKFYDEFLIRHNLDEKNCITLGVKREIQKLVISNIKKFYKVKSLNKFDSTLDEQEEHFLCFETMVEDIPLYWYTDDDDTSYGPFLEDKNKERCLDIIGERFWKELGTDNVVAQKHEKKFQISHDDLASDTLPSSFADEYAETVKRFIDFEEGPIHRALLFYGTPGTGKSTILRKISENLGLRTLRISFEDLGNDMTSLLMPSIQLLKPEILIMDDIDRGNTQSLIHLLEEFKKHVKVILASANYPELMDEAVLRPGRFDDAISVELLDLAVINKLVGENVPKDHRKVLQALPIVYVNEFNNIRKVLGDEEAFSSIQSLANRVGMGKNPTKSKSRNQNYFPNDNMECEDWPDGTDDWGGKSE